MLLTAYKYQFQFVCSRYPNEKYLQDVYFFSFLRSVYLSLYV